MPNGLIFTLTRINTLILPEATIRLILSSLLGFDWRLETRFMVIAPALLHALYLPGMDGTERQADDLRALADSAAASLPEHLLIPAARLMTASLRPDIQQALTHLLHAQSQRPNPFNLTQSGLSWRRWQVWQIASVGCLCSVSITLGP